MYLYCDGQVYAEKMINVTTPTQWNHFAETRFACLYAWIVELILLLEDTIW